MKFWCAREDALIRDGYATGKRKAVVAKELGRTKNSVIGRANRLGLKCTDRKGPHSASLVEAWAKMSKAARRRRMAKLNAAREARAA